jgi:hypothetical protein
MTFFESIIDNIPLIIVSIIVIIIFILIMKYAPILICQKNPLTGECLDSSLNNMNDTNNKRK